MIDIEIVTAWLVFAISVIVIYKHLEVKIMNKLFETYRVIEDKINGDLSEIKNEFKGQDEKIKNIRDNLKFALKVQNKILKVMLLNYQSKIEKKENEKTRYNHHEEYKRIENVIPIDLEKLNETERKVLIFLANSDKVNVREIQQHINKSREHTARIMKKLYDEGYVERETRGKSYRYWIREEVRRAVIGELSLF